MEDFPSIHYVRQLLVQLKGGPVNHHFLSTVLKISILVSLIITNHGFTQDYKPKFKGIEITGKTTTGKVDDRIENQLRYHIQKCDGDSWTFTRVLFTVGKYFEQTGKAIKIVAYADHSKMIYIPQDLGEFLIDIGDLRVLPDPIRAGNGKFKKITATPPWATTICAFLGHEIEEALADLKAGKRDWDKHHFKIANPTEDAIVKDYFGATRKRGRDCSEEHKDHQDIVLEFDVGLIRLHKAPDRVQFNPVNGKALYHFNSGRLSYITYEAGAKFPGANNRGRCAKQP